MKAAENVWDAIAADLAAVTAATDGPDENSSEDLVEEVEKSKNSESTNDSGTPRPESSSKETQDGPGEGAKIDTNGNNSSSTLPRYVVKEEPQGGVKAKAPTAQLITPKREEVEPDFVQNVVDILSDSTDEKGDHVDTGRGGKKDKGENILGKRNRSSDQTVSGGSQKRTKVQVSASSDGGELSQRDQPDGTAQSGETSRRSQEQRHKPLWGDSLGTTFPLPSGLEKLGRMFTSLNTACGYLLKQQLVPSWQNVKQAIQRLSGDSEPISVEDVRLLAQISPRMIVLSQFSGEGEDASFHIELLDPSGVPKVDLPGSTNGRGANSGRSTNSSDPKSAEKQVSDSEAKNIVERRQKAFQLLLAQMAAQLQVSANAGERLFGDVITSIRSLAPQSCMVPVSGEERAKHTQRHLLPATLRPPGHEGRHTLGPPLLPLPTQSIVLPPPSLMPQQLQHGFMNMPGGYSGKERFDTAVERWKRVESFLKENKVVDRDAAACKNKWEAILSDYKSIKDWNRKPGNTVYSLLNPAEKKAANLPAIFPLSVIELMDTFSFNGKSSAAHAPKEPEEDSLARNNTAVGVGGASAEDASAPEENGEPHPSGHSGDGIQGPAVRKKKSNGSSSLVAAFDRLSANMLNIEKGRDERSERIWALENRKYDLERSKYELQARKVEAEREDRKGLVKVLGNLAGAFHRMADKM
ncbi:hypothetical protein R1flu_013216 [Riccia fluitans]|uniref:CDT1 Geminin-binding domain-containing protein n=1 Tax=Riccia fluitans TaxID=41844 RepID=A0ABD1YCY1_9MARC